MISFFCLSSRVARSFEVLGLPFDLVILLGGLSMDFS